CWLSTRCWCWGERSDSSGSRSARRQSFNDVKLFTRLSMATGSVCEQSGCGGAAPRRTTIEGGAAGALRARGNVIGRVPVVSGVLAIDDKIRMALPERFREHARGADRHLRLEDRRQIFIRNVIPRLHLVRVGIEDAGLQSRALDGRDRALGDGA